MKRAIAFLMLLVSVCIVAFAQNNGIEVQDIKVNTDDKGVPNGSYTVDFRDKNFDVVGNAGLINNFTWYLSYKGKRVSDYYSSTTNVRNYKISVKAVTWPNDVPKGNEKFVTVQFGKESEKKDRRDDDR